MALRKKEFKSFGMRWAEHVARMKQVEILTYKLKTKSLGRRRLRCEFGMTVDLNRNVV